jgi:hypothetical protein
LVCVEIQKRWEQKSGSVAAQPGKAAVLMPWIFDRLCGEFVNGRSMASVPKKFHPYYDRMGYLQRTLRTWLGSVPANRYYGAPMLGDTFAEVPADIKEREKTIRKVILDNEPNVKKVDFGLWGIDKKGAYLHCVAVCRLKNNEKFKYKFNFIGDGVHTVRPWSVALL